MKRKYTDRIKETEVPLFKNYVFVQIRSYEEQIKVLRLDGVVNYVRHSGQPARMRNGEIEELREMVNSYDHFEVTPVNPGKVIRLNDGVFQGFTGIVQEVSKNKVILELPQLGLKLDAWIGNLTV